jgi:hypothetical protein
MMKIIKLIPHQLPKGQKPLPKSCCIIYVGFATTQDRPSHPGRDEVCVDRKKISTTLTVSL